MNEQAAAVDMAQEVVTKARAQIVVANKTDIMEDESLLEKLRTHVEPLGYPLFALSAASHTGDVYKRQDTGSAPRGPCPSR